MPSDAEMTNQGFRMFLFGLADMLGQGGLNTLLHKADLPQFIDNPPPSNHNFSGIKVSFAGRIQQAFLDVYGRRQSRVILYQIGRSQSQKMLKENSAVFSAVGLAMKFMPRRQKIKMLLENGARQLVTIGMQAAVHEENQQICLDVSECYQCEGIQSDTPVCHLTRGQIDAFMEWVLGSRQFKLQEVLCKAKGAPVCRFIVEETEVASVVEAA